jgi:type IV pilus assembly protein PilC
VQQALSLPGETIAKARRAPVRPEELGRTISQLAAKLKAGLSLSQALYALSVETKNATLATALKEVKASVDKGRPVGEALLDFPEVFNSMSVELLATGEQFNRLQAQTQCLSTYLDATNKIARALQAATVRPARALGLGLLAWAAVLALGLPSFESAVRSLNMVEWPWATHLTMRVAGVVRTALPLALTAAVLMVVAWRWLSRNEKGILLKSSLLLSTPVIGPLWRAKAINDFARATGALAAAGLPTRMAIEHGAMATDSLAVRAAAVLALDKGTKGRDLPTALAEVGLIDRSEINSMQAAERRGNLGEVMLKHAETSDADLYRHSVHVKNLAEFVAILLLGLLVAGTAAGFVVPAFLGR